MEGFKVWVGTISVFSIILLLFRTLFPDGNVKKAGEVVMALLMMLIMLQPIFKIMGDSTLQMPNFETVDLYEIGQEQIGANGLKEKMQSVLKAKGIAVDEIVLATDLDEENYLVLSGVQISISSDNTDEEIYSCLQSELEIPPEIITINR